ncbi:hypothetical protein [Sphingopyxis sp. C-1]|uniref:hypothetical protein n=1 Tax=Sphingopyxis sp. C-1 TaxID=262667 RepID=UPI0006C6D22C|nr:hypothetical protein [Sphingopyxis sp. C-1]GAO78640.1 hypothetical protein SC1_01949 [Sphingopyxis sp. C-1]
MTSIGDTAQTRAIAEQVGQAAAEIAIRDFVNQHPHFAPTPAEKAEMPTLMKWGGGIAATIIAAAIIWMAATLNSLQITVARMDERQQQDMTGKRLDAVETRVTTLEAYHRAMPKG